MNRAATQFSNGTSWVGEVIYRTICENLRCGIGFDLKITRANIEHLSRRFSCPRCGGPRKRLKRDQRPNPRLFSSRLQSPDFTSKAEREVANKAPLDNLIGPAHGSTSSWL